MKISKETALKTIRDAELTEFLMYSSDVVDILTHVHLCAAFQRLANLAEKSTLSEFEGET